MINKKVSGISGKVFSYILRYVFFLSLSYILVYPLIYIFVNSLKDLSNAYDATVNWVPKYLYFGNLLDAIKVFDLKHTALRSFVYEILASLIQFCSCAVAAYGLARFDLKGKSLMSILMIVNILVPSMMIIIPSYVNFSQMDFMGILGLISRITGKDIRPNLIGTPLVFYLPALLGVGLKGGLFVYIYSQFFKGLPKELEEAAWIDGAGAWKTFLKIVIPSSSSAIITVLLFSVVWYWNDYYLAQMYMSEPTFSVAIYNFSSYSITDKLGLSVETARYLNVPMILSGCVWFISPMLLFYLAMQRRFMASVATSGIVG